MFTTEEIVNEVWTALDRHLNGEGIRQGKEGSLILTDPNGNEWVITVTKTFAPIPTNG